MTVLLVAVHLWAGRLKLLHVIPRSRWLSASGGAAVAYIFIHLLPELPEHQRSFSSIRQFAWLEHHVYLLALVGFGGFYGLERLVQIHRPRDRRQPVAVDRPAADGTAIFWMHIVTFAAYNVLIGYLLLHRYEANAASTALFGSAMALHLLVNDVGLHDHHGPQYDRLGRWVLAGGVITGVAVGWATQVPDAAVATLFSLLGGSAVLNIVKEELPKERESRFWAFATGAAGYTALLLAVSRS